MKFYNFSAPTKYQSNTNELTCLTHQKTTLVQHEKLIAYLYNQSVIITGQKSCIGLNFLSTLQAYPYKIKKKSLQKFESIINKSLVNIHLRNCKQCLHENTFPQQDHWS